MFWATPSSSRMKAEQILPNIFELLCDRSPGVGARGRRPLKSADPLGVRRAGAVIGKLLLLVPLWRVYRGLRPESAM